MAARPKKSTEIPDVESVQNNKPIATADKFSIGGLFWGVVLLVVGGLFLLNNLGIMPFHITNVLSLWPLIIIAIGLSMLSITGTAARVVAGVVIVAVVGAIVMASIGVIKVQETNSDSTSTEEVDVAIENDSIESSKVIINSGAGNVTIDSEDVDGVVQAKLESSFARLQQSVRVQNGVQEVELETEGSTGWWSGQVKNDLFVTLTRALILDLQLNTGAANVVLDAEDIQLRHLDIDAGASKLDIRLGDLVEEVSVGLDVGMSSVTFTVPEEAGVRVEVDAGMSSRDVDGLEEVRDGVYASENFEDAEVKIRIEGDMGMSSFELERY